MEKGVGYVDLHGTNLDQGCTIIIQCNQLNVHVEIETKMEKSNNLIIDHENKTPQKNLKPTLDNTNYQWEINPR